MELVTTSLVSEVEIQSTANTIAEFFKNTASTQIVIFLNYIRNSIQANYIISALNTNMVSTIFKKKDDISNLPDNDQTRRRRREYNEATNETQQTNGFQNSRFSRAATQYSEDYGVFRAQTLYFPNPSFDLSNVESIACGKANPISAAGFFSTYTKKHITVHVRWDIPAANSEVVNGFFGGCTPLEALLPSTFNCLYEIECLQLLTKYFPALQQVCMRSF